MVYLLQDFLRIQSAAKLFLNNLSSVLEINLVAILQFSGFW